PRAEEEGPAEASQQPLLHYDPLGMLAREAGYSDGERWWDQLVESRRYSEGDLFAEARDAMAALREQITPRDQREAEREAYMRKSIRAALKEGFERIAVVCGAWHAPALDPARFPTATHDN